MVRLIIAVIGLPPLVILGGLVYSTAFIRSSHYGAYIFFCIVYGLFCYLLFLLSRCVRASALLWIPIFIVAWTGPFIVGHYYGFRDNQYAVWRLVQDETGGRFDPEWKNMDRSQVFDRYVQAITGNSLGGFPAYLSLMAHEGWSGFERTGAVSYKIERKGIWVWIAWGMHLVFLLVATAAAMGATITDKDLRQKYPSPEHKRRQKTPSPTRAPQEEPQYIRSPAWITTDIKPENEQEPNGWWVITASFKGREASFRGFYPNKQPTGRSFFQDVSQTLYCLKNEGMSASQGMLAVLVRLGSVEGGLTAKEALDKLREDEKKLRYLLDKYYFDFENGDEKFFAQYFGKDGSR